MTKIEAIDALLVKVKAGEFDPTNPDKPIWKFNKFCDAFEDAFGLCDRHLEKFWNAYKGSTDAAIALIEAVLPGWVINCLRLWLNERGKPDAFAEIYGTHEFAGERYWHHPSDGRATGESDTPARALLIAILEALIAMEKNNG